MIWQKKLDLDILIHYYVLLKNTGYPETRVLLGSVLMEGVKYAYAAHYKQYPRDKNGFFLKPDRKKYSFRDLIKEVYDEFDLKHGDTGFIQYRDEVVHRGCAAACRC